MGGKTETQLVRHKERLVSSLRARAYELKQIKQRMTRKSVNAKFATEGPRVLDDPVEEPEEFPEG